MGFYELFSVRWRTKVNAGGHCLGLGSYSYRKLSIGFAVAALIAWKLIVINEINNAIPPAKKKIHQLIFIL